MHALGLSPTQIMTWYKQNVKELAKWTKWVTRCTFLLISEVRDIYKKRVEELWKKLPSDSITVQMWVHETLTLCFKKIQEHYPLNLNNNNQENMPFSLGIQPWNDNNG